MALAIDRPLAFIDLETTGTDVATDRIIEISILKLFPDGEKTIYTKRVKPNHPIKEHATAVHGITNADLENEPTFQEIAPEVLELLDETDMAGYNSNRFDVPLLVEEFLRNGFHFNARKRRLIDVQTIFHKMEQRTLSAAYRFYCDKELVDAHSAEADTIATYEILEAQVERYEDVLNNMDFLATFSNHHPNFIDFAGRIAYDKDGVECFNFGKFKGRPVADVLGENPGYFSWILNNDFPQDTKRVLAELKEKIAQA